MYRRMLVVFLAVLNFALLADGEDKADTSGGDLSKQWKITDFDGTGPVKFEKDVIYLYKGDDLTGVNWTGKFPRINYEITLEAMRIDGDDFFCGLTFPYKESSCSFIVGGWGGTCCGISSLDYQDAYNNETARFRNFEKNRWYRIKVRATDNRIQAWIDDEQLVDIETADRKIDVRLEVEESKPLGISTWRTTGAIRDFTISELPPVKQP